MLFCVFSHTTAVIRLVNAKCGILDFRLQRHVCPCCVLILFGCLFRMRRARDAPAAEAANEAEQSFQDEALAPAPRCRGRGRGRGRPRMAPAQEIEQEPVVELEAP